jgi:hypothetical protein
MHQSVVTVMTPEEALRNILKLVEGSDEVEDAHAMQILLQSIKTLAEKGMVRVSPDPLGTACELVGRFQYHFSRIDKALDVGIAKVFSLDDAAAAVLLANMDFMRKVNIIRVMSALQFTDDGSLAKLLSEIAGVNNPHRQTVIHSTFEPEGDDSVKFRRTTTSHVELVTKESVWTSSDFAKRFAEMHRLATELEKVIAALQPFTHSLDFSDPRNSMYLAMI